MKPFSKIISLSFFLFSFTIFFSSCFSQSSLPDTWQHNMSLTMTYGGGMRYYSSTVVIREDSSYSEVDEEGKITRTQLHFTKAQLDELIKTLKTNRFDKISADMRPGIVYDMGTSTTLLNWGNKVFGYSVGATLEIPAKDEKRYQAVSAYLAKFMSVNTD